MGNVVWQSELMSVLLNEFKATPEGMIAVIQKFLDSSQTILMHGDIDPLFEDVVVILLRWIEEDNTDLIRDFLGRLQTRLLKQPGFEIPSVALTPEKHLHTKFSTLANILGVALRITLAPPPRLNSRRRSRKPG